MKHSAIEPGIFPIFRLFTGLRLAFAVLRYLAPRDQGTLIDILGPGLLLLVLLIPLIQARYERIVLPIALVISGIEPFVTQALLFDQRPADIPTDTYLVLHLWGSMVILLLPLVIIAWQYRFREVLAFTVGITLANLAMIEYVTGHEWLETMLVSGSLVFRFVLFTVAGILVVRLMQGQRAQRHALTEANLKLTNHAVMLEQLATTRERNRLARELHDTLAHTLSALAVQLEAVDALWTARPDQAHERLQRSIETTRSGLTETRRVLQDLRASPLEDLGLALSIRNLAQSTAARAGLTLDLHVEERLGSLRPDIEHATYRIAQEALANAANHANAHHLTIQLKRSNLHLTLTVSDDGQGFDPQQVATARRLGMKGMQERADMVGGTLTVESQPGQGTIVMFSVKVAE